MSICLDTTTKSLELVLGSVPTTEITYSTHYASKTLTSFNEKNTTGLSNGTTPVTIILAPAANETLSIKNIILHNPNAEITNVSISLKDDLTSYILYNINISPNSSWKLADGLRGEPGTSPEVLELTQAQYDALSPNYDANTFYVING